MKIVFLCEFSAGACGVWNRIYNIAKILAKRHDVYVLSSNITKGTEKIAKPYEELDGINIYRFPVYFRIGANALFWNYEKKLQEIKPDIINAHVYRHPHSTTILKIAKKLNAKYFLTTHAPFVEKELRNPLLNTVVSFYDKYFARKILNSYTKVIAITKWEIPFLIKLGCKRNKILYIPNGFPQEYLKTKIKYNKTKKKTIIFLGRIAPIKNLEMLIESFKELLDKGHKLNLKLVGPIERGYELPLINLIKKLKLNGKVEFTGPIFNLNRKIKILQDSDIFVLPSKREASPLALIEAMSLGMIVLSSNTKGANEFLIDGKNGFIFN
ncbi:MAG: glycosyltransferase family 4 protein, partial [Nanoarchaeota archaeon]|nr:glycosyltransferase family 4 protein [Nanoarchaeota archaeon]